MVSPAVYIPEATTANYPFLSDAGRSDLNGVYSRFADIASDAGLQVTNESERADFVLYSDEELTIDKLRAAAEPLAGLALPETVDYQTFANKPHFPVVAKNSKLDQGKGVFWLDTREQWETFRKVLAGGATVREYPGYDFDATRAGSVKMPWQCPPNSEEQRQSQLYWDAYAYTRLSSADANDQYQYQEHITTPIEGSSFRVLAGATGKIIASTLHYRPKAAGDSMTLPGSIHDFDATQHLATDAMLYRDSKVFADLKDRRSNRAVGGQAVVLDPLPVSKPPTSEDLAALEAHDIDPGERKLPEDLRYYSSQLGRILGSKYGVVFGFDFLQGIKGKKYLIEANILPDSGAYVDRHGLSLDSEEGILAMHGEAFESLHQTY